MLKYLPFLLILGFLLTQLSCQRQTNNSASDIPPPLPTPTRTGGLTAVPPQPADEESFQLYLKYGQTNIQPDGNRVVQGIGNIRDLTPIDIPLNGQPAWVTAVAYEEGAYWVTLLEDGQALAFFIANGDVREVPITPSKLTAGTPPYLQLLGEDQLKLLVPPAANSSLTHPILFNSFSQQMAFIDLEGNLIIETATGNHTLAVNAQPDARILEGPNSQLLLFTQPTNEYPHAIMGDNLEAKGITIVRTMPEPQILRTIPAQDGFVFEGIAPIWADLNGDGKREIIATQSNRNVGAQLVLFDEQGNLLAEGPAIGLGNRWRHQLAVAPFGPNQELELVDIRTPHIGGPTEFFQWQGDQLVIVATASGYTSHVIGSRNLDLAVVGHFDESGKMTLVVPSQFRDHLGGIQRTENGAEVAWTLEINGRLLTNIYALPLQNNQLALGIGTDDNSLRIWQGNQ